MKNDVLRVLHVSSGLGVGGAETMLYRLVQALHGKNGQHHSVVSLNDNCCFDFEALGVPLEIIDFKSAGAVAGMTRLRRKIRAEAPHLVQGWMYHGNFAATLAAPGNTPVVWSIHHSLHNLNNESLPIRTMIRTGGFVGRRSNTRKIIFVSEMSERHHAALGYPRDKSLIVPNGFNCADFAPDSGARRGCRNELGFQESDLLLGSFGRYDPIKDHALLLRAFSRVLQHFPDARLLLAGGGVDEANPILASLIRHTGVGANVRLLGQRNDMPRLYNSLDLYVLSSKSESFPNVLGEASACAVPCITTDVGDSRRILGNTGRVVPPGSESELAAAMVELLRMSPADRRAMGEQARANVRSNYDLPVVAHIYASLYTALGRPTAA